MHIRVAENVHKRKCNHCNVNQYFSNGGGGKNIEKYFSRLMLMRGGGLLK